MQERWEMDDSYDELQVPTPPHGIRQPHRHRQAPHVPPATSQAGGKSIQVVERGARNATGIGAKMSGLPDHGEMAGK